MDVSNSTIALLALALAAVALLMQVFGGSPDINVSTNDQQHTISVEGKSERLVAPDTAKVSFSMTRKDANLSRATDSVNKRIGELVSGLSQFGIDKKDIQTKNYNVHPEYNYNRENGQQTFSGYRVNQSLELIIRDLDKVSDIMSSVATFKLDNVSGLQFYVDKDEEIQKDLRDEAIADAKKQAKKLASELGVDLHTIVGFNENGGSGDSYPLYTMARNESADFGAKAEIPTGQNEYQKTVSITYLID